MSNTLEGVKLKEAILRSIVPEKMIANPLYLLKVADVHILLCYEGRSIEEVSKFLPLYFKFFEKVEIDSKEPDVKIIYFQPEGSQGEDNWVYWNEWGHEIEFIKMDNYDQIIARDFVAKIDKCAKHFYAKGPRWSFETCDSIDNIISYALGRHLIKYNGLILHAACVIHQEEAFIFFGASGAGKSTLAEFCFRKYGFKVISSDQLIVRYSEGSLYAQVMPTTIPEFPLNHPARETQQIKVKAMLHLVQSTDIFSFKELTEVEWLKFFMKELVYRNEFGNEKKIFDLSLKIVQDQDIIKGEMSYQKESLFFEKLLNRIKR